MTRLTKLKMSGQAVHVDDVDVDDDDEDEDDDNDGDVDDDDDGDVVDDDDDDALGHCPNRCKMPSTQRHKLFGHQQLANSFTCS